MAYRIIYHPKAEAELDLRAWSLPGQQTEVAIGCAVLNRMLAYASPKSVRRGRHGIISRFKDRLPFNSRSVHQCRTERHAPALERLFKFSRLVLRGWLVQSLG
jgi:hypothetical protein